MYNKEAILNRSGLGFWQSVILDLDEPHSVHKLPSPRLFGTSSHPFVIRGSSKVTGIDSSSIGADYKDAIRISVGMFPTDVRDNISDEMKSKLRVNNELRESVIEAIREIKSYLDGKGSVKADVDRDVEDPTWVKNRIKVEADINSVKEWKKLNDSIKKIVRKSEKENVMIYTYVDRKKS